MKKLFCYLCLIILFLGCASLNTKKIACEQACESSYDECKEDAGDNAAKVAACTVAKEKCLSECN